jgi:hypothetical protein
MTAKGAERQRTKQIGEYLVAAKLMEKGWQAVTFSGNMPSFDILATKDEGKAIKVQVKTNRKGDWQLDISKFVEMTFDKANGTQEMGESVKLPSDLYFVLVKMDSHDIMRSNFYVIPARTFQGFLVERYREGLESIEGKRPINPESTHLALSERELIENLGDSKDNWGILDSSAE